MPFRKNEIKDIFYFLLKKQIFEKFIYYIL